MRRPVIDGNWKMFKTRGEAVEFIDELKKKVSGVVHCDIVVAPPFTALADAAQAAKGSRIGIAAQDVHWDSEGAHTGDVSPGMLLDAGCSYVIIGHSERRHDHGETDEQVNLKLKAALPAGLTPIVCVGETLEEREGNQTQKVLERQFQRGFAGLTPSEFSRIIMAYEPVWAIGTGRTATPEQAEESHAFLRELTRAQFGGEQAQALRILYGGSVKPENIKGLMAQPDLDGALVGGASLKVASFGAIVDYPSA